MPSSLRYTECLYFLILLFKCVNSERDLFHVDNTRQVRGVLSRHTKRGEIVVEQIGRGSGSYYS